MTENQKISDDSDDPIIDDNVIRIQLRKQSQSKWELRTRNLSPGIRFPTIQLFDCEGNLLVETNDENISIKSSDFDDCTLRTSQSLRDRDFRHYIDKKPLRKHKTISGGKIYTRIFKKPSEAGNNPDNNKSYVVRNSSSVLNIPSRFNKIKQDITFISPFQSDGTSISELSSYKSSDNEKCDKIKQKRNNNRTELVNGINFSTDNKPVSFSEGNQPRTVPSNKENGIDLGLSNSKSFNSISVSLNKDCHVPIQKDDYLPRSKSEVCMYGSPSRKVSFLNTYLKSLPARNNSNPDWLSSQRHVQIERQQSSENESNRLEPSDASPEKSWRFCKTDDNTSENEFINIPTDVAADCEMKKRLKMYRRGLSEIEPRHRKPSNAVNRRHSVAGDNNRRIITSSSSESVDEADQILNRLKRRILRNKMREKRRSIGAKYAFKPEYTRNNCTTFSEPSASTDWLAANILSVPEQNYTGHKELSSV